MSPKNNSLPKESQSKKTDVVAKTPHTRKRALVFFVVVVALALISYGSYNLYQWWQRSHTKVAASEDFDVSEPSENPLSVNDPAPFTYEANQPKTIDISALGVSAYIQKVGLRKNNSIGVPSNIHLAGWFSQSARPGEKGLSIIDGHVQGTYNPGIFKDLAKLKKDDIITITFGDDSQKVFSVVSVATVPLEKASDVLLSHDPKITNELHLVTCAGSYAEKLKTYNERVIVVAKSIK